MITTTQITKAFLLALPMFFLSGSISNKAQKVAVHKECIAVTSPIDSLIKRQQDTLILLKLSIRADIKKLKKQ